MSKHLSRTKLVLVLSIVLALAFIFTSLASFQVSKESFREQSLGETLPLISNNIYSEIQADIMRPVHVSSLMANDTFVKDWAMGGERELEAIANYLREIKQRYGFFTTFFVSHRTHKYYSYKGIHKVISPSDKHDVWYYNFIKSMKPVELDVDTDEAHQGKLTIFINHRVVDHQGKLLGVTGVGLNMDQVGDILASYRAKYNRVVYLVDSKGLVQVHAENVHIIDHMNAVLEKEGKLEPYYHAMSRPNIAEEEAIYRASKMVELTGSRIYIVHLSSKEGLWIVKEARDRGINIYAETCPQYLLLDDERYKEPDWNGAKYVMSPPLRTKESNAALWEGLRGGDLQVVATDHCPFDFNGIKDMNGKGDYKKIPNGAPGIETLLIMLHSEGVAKGRISLEKMVNVLSSGTARMFGLKDKGEIAVGKDADIVVFDPDQKFTVTQSKLHMNVDYTPYEGFEVTGMPKVVYSRGKKVSEWNGDQMAFVGEVGRGRFIKREPFEPF